MWRPFHDAARGIRGVPYFGAVAQIAAPSDWEEMEVLVTVKAYPAISGTYGEVVCVAGVRLDAPKPHFVRFFPVHYRDLQPEQRFHKYQVIRLRACRHSTDRRAESYRPDTDSIRLGQFLPPDSSWAARRRWLDPLVEQTMCALVRGRKGGSLLAPSLGLVRPARVISIGVQASEDWSETQDSMRRQGSLFSAKRELERAPYTFRYRWHCEEPGCRGHTQTIADWEIGEAYRSWQRQGHDPVEAISHRWLDVLCAERRDTHFFVGDQHQRPGKFLVLGVLWPERRAEVGAGQLALAA